MRVRIVATGAAVAALALVGAAGCSSDSDDGGGSSDGGADTELVDAMVGEGAPQDVAECYVEALGDDARRLWEASDDELSDDEQQQIQDALVECDPSATTDGG